MYWVVPPSVTFKSYALTLTVVISQTFIFVFLSAVVFHRIRVKPGFGAGHGCCYDVPLYFPCYTISV